VNVFELMYAFRVINSDVIENSVGVKSQLVPKGIVSPSRDGNKKIFTQSGISELERESRYQGHHPRLRDRGGLAASLGRVGRRRL